MMGIGFVESGESDGVARSESVELRLAVRCDVAAPRLARKAFDVIEGIDAVRDSARLVVSELVSNAVRHSGCVASDLSQVRVSRRDGFLTVAVTDRGMAGGTPRMRPHQPDGRGGLGLSIVAKLSSRWGTRRTAGDCCLVWAELAIGPGD
jgi:hypothetical protein